MDKREPGKALEEAMREHPPEVFVVVYPYPEFDRVEVNDGCSARDHSE